MSLRLLSKLYGFQESKTYGCFMGSYTSFNQTCAITSCVLFKLFISDVLTCHVPLHCVASSSYTVQTSLSSQPSYSYSLIQILESSFNLTSLQNAECCWLSSFTVTEVLNAFLYHKLKNLLIEFTFKGNLTNPKRADA